MSLNHDFPTKLCDDCIERLENALSFRDLCRRSEEFLETQRVNYDFPGEFLRCSSPESELLLSLGQSLTCIDKDAFGQKGWRDLGFVKHIIRKKDLKLPEAKRVAKLATVPQSPSEQKFPAPKNEVKIEEMFEGVEELDEVHEFPEEVFDDESTKDIKGLPFLDKDFVGYESLPKVVGDDECISYGKLSKTGPFVCQPCNITYTNRNSFHTHWYHKHKHAGRQFMCEECGKVYKKADQLREHLNVHLPVKPYQCDICGARFTRKYAVVNHMFMHTKKKRYQCQFCPKAYTFYSGRCHTLPISVGFTVTHWLHPRALTSE